MYGDIAGAAHEHVRRREERMGEGGNVYVGLGGGYLSRGVLGVELLDVCGLIKRVDEDGEVYGGVRCARVAREWRRC